VAVQRTLDHWTFWRNVFAALAGLGVLLAVGAYADHPVPAAAAPGLAWLVLWLVLAMAYHRRHERIERIAGDLVAHPDRIRGGRLRIASSSSGGLRHAFLQIDLDGGAVEDLRVREAEAAELAGALQRLSPDADFDVPGLLGRWRGPAGVAPRKKKRKQERALKEPS
jgi:hypothetical protein